MKHLFSFALLLACYTLPAQTISTQQFSTGYTRISTLANCGDNRLFVVEQDGKISFCDLNGTKHPNAFLDIDALVKSSGNEQGLLGLAFHPQYKQNGYFFVDYINNSNNTVVARYSVNPNDSTQADPNSALIILTITQPYSNHNGGDLHFGPDGYLYISTGDGGSAGDPGNRAQNPLERLGKMLRIDVDNASSSQPYVVPPTNPFVALSSHLPELWSLGLRNPWRFSFDRLTGDMWIGDVGQNVYEEVDFQPANSPGGENYGWRCYEGLNHAYNTTGCQPASSYVAPVFEYSHTGGSCSITGGYVYRGNVYADLYGKYIVCDYCSGKFWLLTPNGTGGFTSTADADLMDYNFGCMGEDLNGEIYLGGNANGIVYKLKGKCLKINPNAQITNADCSGGNTGEISLNATGGTGALVYSWWNNGSTASSLSQLAGGTYTVSITDGMGCVESFDFLVEVEAPFTVTPTIQHLTCFGINSGAIYLDVSGAGSSLTYSWSNGSQNDSLTNLAAGTYSCTITDASANCTITQTYTVNQPTQLSVVASMPIPNNGVVTANVTGGTPPYVYTWSNGDTGQSSNCSDSVELVVLITDANGCTATDSVLCIPNSIKTPSFVRSFSLLPNPTSDKLRLAVQFSQPLQAEIEIWNNNGQLVHKNASINGDEIQALFDVSKYASGIYVLKINTEKGIWIERWMKE